MPPLSNPLQMPATCGGLFDPTTWLRTDAGPMYGAYRIDGASGPLGQLLVVPPGYSSAAAYADLLGKDGWKWAGTAWPASFDLEPLTLVGFTAELAVPPIFFAGGVLSAAGPVAAAATSDQVWRLEIKSDPVGFVVRTADTLRWLVHPTGTDGDHLKPGPYQLRATDQRVFLGSFREAVDTTP